MLPLFRTIRQKLLAEGHLGKYLVYATGEIILVVAGILIALQVNTWNQQRQDDKLAEFYMRSLSNDLIKDTLDINRIIEFQTADNNSTQYFLNRLLSPSCTIDTLIKIARKEFDYGFRVKRDYANNTFNTIISSGNIELLDKELINKLMDLNVLQQDQLKRFDSHIDTHHNLLSIYVQRFPVYIDVPEISLIDSLLWKNVDERALAGNFTSLLGYRQFMFGNTIRGHLRVKEKSKEILELIETLLEK